MGSRGTHDDANKAANRPSSNPQAGADAPRRARSPSQAPESDVWLAVPPRTYDHMAKVARDARRLLEVLSANIEGVRGGFENEVAARELLEGLGEIDTCCERLNNMLEDALLGARREGLTIQRTTLSLTSLLAAASRQVARSAEAKGVVFRVATEVDVVARLDRGLFTRALVTLMTRMIRDSAAGVEIVVSYALEHGVVTLRFDGPASVRPAPGLARAEAPDVDLDFCHLVTECHGGSLAIGVGVGPKGPPLYRIALPWVGAVGAVGAAE